MQHLLAKPSAAQKAVPKPPDLTLYADPPTDDISIEEFEQLALDRLKVLKGLEKARLRNQNEESLKRHCLDLWKTHMKAGSLQESYRKDVISHFILRIVYSSTQEHRDWFRKHEVDIFGFRLDDLTTESKLHFLESNGLPYRPLARDELMALAPTLAAVHRSCQEIDAATRITDYLRRNGEGADVLYYKVPFERVPKAVAQRKVLVRKGFAYVGKERLYELIQMDFKVALSQSLQVMSRKLYGRFMAQEADRLAPIVDSLPNRYLGNDYSQASTTEHCAEEVPELSRRHFPLCMQHMVSTLHSEHHLKHWGRQQLGLFLKGVGLPVEEAIRFWRMEFTPKTVGEAFDKQYLYNIRHMYGKEGKKTDYSPMSCVKIIGLTVGAGDSHGCPYKTFTDQQLRVSLRQAGCSERVVEEAVAKAKAKHFQVACSMAFEGSHGCACDTGINHPNQYYTESKKLADAQQPGSAPTTPGVLGMLRGQAMATPATAPARMQHAMDVDTPMATAPLTAPPARTLPSAGQQ